MAYQYILGGPAPCDQHGIPFSAEVPPLSTEVLNGMANTDGGTLLVIPANTTTKVSISMSATMATASTTGTSTITITGTGSPSPATGATLAAITLQTNSGISALAESLVFPDIWLFSGTSTLTLKLNFGGVTRAVATVNGKVVT